MFVRGELDLGSAPALTLPQSAVLLRDGFAYVFRVEPGDTVAQTKVEVARRRGDRIEILSGLDPTAAVVATGAGFLADGDPVRVVDAPVAGAPQAPSVGPRPVPGRLGPRDAAELPAPTDDPGQRREATTPNEAVGARHAS
jgi:hypothetical protein